LGRDVLQNGTDAEHIIRLALQNGAIAYKITERVRIQRRSKPWLVQFTHFCKLDRVSCAGDEIRHCLNDGWEHSVSIIVDGLSNRQQE